MPSVPIISEKRVIDALQKNAGNVRDTAAALGVDRSSLNKRINKSPTLLDAKREAGEIITDLAEGVLMRKLRDNNLTAAMFILNNHPAAKAQGWGPRTEVTGAAGNEIVFKVVYGNGEKRVHDPTA